ncbi:MAG: hypothetical protein V4527_10100 [Pseudomonadota bacterium]
MLFLRAACAAVILASAGSAAAQQSDSEAAIRSQWFTGTLLSPSPGVPHQGVLGIEPYLIDKRGMGVFDANGIFHSTPAANEQVRSYTSFNYGFTDAFSLQLIPAVAHVSHDGDTQTGLADLPIRLHYRPFPGALDFWHPSLTTTFGITLPLGKFEHLRNSADGFGTGAYMAMEEVELQQRFTTWLHPHRLRMWARVSQPLNTVDLHGVTSYGTAQGFLGTAVPGSSAELGIGDEVGIDQQWALALDLLQNFAKGPHLRGLGVTGAMADIEGSEFWVAPGIEYNPTEHVGIVAGVEISMAGRNTPSQVIPQIAVNMFFE